MEIEEKQSVKVKIHWGKQKIDFLLDKSEDMETFKGREI